MTATILVVDDSQVERLLAESLLTRNGTYEVLLAASGEEALEMLARQVIDAAVTDLVMPEMNGAELTREIRRRYPDVPVILMTAFGNEATAVEALEAGAASYVPKSQRAERLLEAVERVVARAVAQRQRSRLDAGLLEYRCRYALDNDAQLIRSLVDHIQQILIGCRFGDSVACIRIGEALEEALLNAMYHGNLEFNEHELAEARNELDDRLIHRWAAERGRDPDKRDRKIMFVMHLADDEVRFVIRDQGRGFSSSFTSAGTVESFAQGSHRGLTLMYALMDEVRYNEAGNELTMVSRKEE